MARKTLDEIETSAWLDAKAKADTNLSRRYKRSERQVSQYGACQPLAPVEAYGPCPAPLRQSDELYCARCHMRWAADEAKPPCTQPTRD